MNLPTRQSDPSGLFGSIGAAVGAILALLVAFGVDLSQEQVTSILGVVATVGPLVTAWAIRGHAWAPASVERLRVELGPATAYELDAEGNPVQVHPGTSTSTSSVPDTHTATGSGSHEESSP